MAKLSYKVSYYVFYVCIAVILVVLAMFYCVGYDVTNAAGLTEPTNTPALMYLMYGMFFLCVAVTVIAAAAQFGAALKDNPGNALKSLLGFVFLIALLVIAWAMGSGEPLVIPGYDGTENVPFWLKLTDMFLYTIYILLSVYGVIHSLL